MSTKMCDECRTVYHALDVFHKKCIGNLANKKAEGKDTDVIHPGGYLTIFGYAALELRNHDLVIFLLKNFKEKLCEYNHLGMDCLRECVLYNNREYFDLFIDNGAEPISDEVIDGFTKHHTYLYKFNQEVNNYPLVISHEGEKEDWNW